MQGRLFGGPNLEQTFLCSTVVYLAQTERISLYRFRNSEACEEVPRGSVEGKLPYSGDCLVKSTWQGRTQCPNFPPLDFSSISHHR